MMYGRLLHPRMLVALGRDYVTRDDAMRDRVERDVEHFRIKSGKLCTKVVEVPDNGHDLFDFYFGEVMPCP